MNTTADVQQRDNLAKDDTVAIVSRLLRSELNKYIEVSVVVSTCADGTLPLKIEL